MLKHRCFSFFSTTDRTDPDIFHHMKKPLVGFEPTTSPLPRVRSTTELQRPIHPEQGSRRERSYPAGSPGQSDSTDSLARFCRKPQPDVDTESIIRRNVCIIIGFLMRFYRVALPSPASQYHAPKPRHHNAWSLKTHNPSPPCPLTPFPDLHVKPCGISRNLGSSPTKTAC